MKIFINLVKKQLIFVFTLLFPFFSSYSQLPQCDMIYMDDYSDPGLVLPGVAVPLSYTPTRNIYSFNPALPVSATNPLLNTIQLPADYLGGFTISEVLGSNDPTQTFYCLTNGANGQLEFTYYSPVTNSWVYTGHYTSAGPNLGAGGGIVYCFDGVAGAVYRYDGTSNATLLQNVPNAAGEGPFDMIVDCEGDWYLLNLSGNNSPSNLRKFSPAGTLLATWPVSNPNNYTGGAGFGIIQGTLYVDTYFEPTSNYGMAFGAIPAVGNTITIGTSTTGFPSTAVTGVFLGNIKTFYDLATCSGAIPTFASIAITANPDALCAGTSVTYNATITGGGSNPQYQWFINGSAVSGATSATFTHITGLNEQITCQLTSSSLCVPERIIMSAPAVIDVVDGSTPVLSYAIDKICTGEAIQIEPVTFTPKSGTFSVSPSTGLNVNTTNGAIDFTGAAVGNYTISYTTKGNRNCPSKTATASIAVLATPIAEIKQLNQVKSLCEGSEIRLATPNYPNATYHWWPQRFFEDNFFENEVSGQFPEGTSTISVFVKDENGCVSRDTTTVKLAPCCKFDIPNAFTPNGDGRNDYFGPVSQTDLAIINFSIFNRWGELVYQGAGPNVSWDGKLKGKALAQGVYTYNLEFRCDGEQFSRKGDVALMR